MSDLRDRIAAVIADRMAALSIQQAITPSAIFPGWSFATADAVIAELGLREERTETETLTNEQGATWFRQGRYRYITDWIADE